MTNRILPAGATRAEERYVRWRRANVIVEPPMARELVTGMALECGSVRLSTLRASNGVDCVRGRSQTVPYARCDAKGSANGRMANHTVPVMAGCSRVVNGSRRVMYGRRGWSAFRQRSRR